MLAGIVLVPAAVHAQGCSPAPCPSVEQGPTVVVSGGPVSTTPETSALLRRVSSPNTVVLTATTSGGLVVGLALTLISLRRRRVLAWPVEEATSPVPVAAAGQHPWSGEGVHDQPAPVGGTYA